MVQTGILLIALLMVIGLAIYALGTRPRRPLSSDLPETYSPPPAQPLRLRVAALTLGAVLRGRARLRMPRGVMRLLRQALRSSDTASSMTLLRDNARELLAPMTALEKTLRHPLYLPASTPREPRMLRLCRELLRQSGQADGKLLLDGLTAWQETAATTLKERASLPLCMRVSLAEQLRSVLWDMLEDDAQRRFGLKLFRRLTATRHPMALLSSQSLSPQAAFTLLAQLRTGEYAALLHAVQTQLTETGCSEAELTARQTRRQVHHADRISRVLSGMKAMEHLSWPDMSEEADPLHQLLLTEPAGIYPRMDRASRAMYRQRIALLARRFGTEEQRTASSLLSLCRSADPDGLMDHAGWYLLEHAGIHALRRRLHTRKGLLRTACDGHAALLYRVGLGLAALVGSWAYLHLGGSLLVLPFYVGVLGAFTHLAANLLLRRLSPMPALPRMAMTEVSKEQRTLIVLPAVIRDAEQAVGLTRRLLCCRRAFPPGAIDCLLLGDHSDSMTMQSGEDEQVLRAARMAVTSLDNPDERFLYLHRRRVWSRDQHAYIGRARRRGALETLNRLLVQGESEDEFDEATFAPGFLHRRYACVFAFTEDAAPAPDALLPLMGALFHPLCERRRMPDGVRGVSLLQPQCVTDSAAASTAAAWLDDDRPCSVWQRLTSRDVAANVALYRPDTLLEAVDGMLLPEMPDGMLLMGELSGCATDEASVMYLHRPTSLNERLRTLHHRTCCDFSLLPWLLPWVKTQRGVERNPLTSHSKARLRDTLRRRLLPLCRLALLLYGVGARLPIITLMAVLCPAADALPGYGWRGLCHLCLLPVEASVQTDALLRTLWRLISREHRQDAAAPASWGRTGGSVPLEWWSQGSGALLTLGLSLMRLPPDLPGLLIGVLFALFPILHTRLDAPLHREERADETLSASLMDTAEAVWRFFEETVTEATHFLPPESLQLKPWRGVSDTLRPEDAGLYLLSCLSARELGILDTDEAARRILRTAEGLSMLPCWHGLPYDGYDAHTLQPLPKARIDAVGCGLLCACLICTAQGMRSMLEEMDAATRDVPAELDALADAMALHRLYDPEAQLFYRSVDPVGEAADDEHLTFFASVGLLLSFLGVLRREIPMEHFARLDRTCVRIGRDTPLMSEHGTMTDYLSPWLLLPLSEGTLMAGTVQSVLRAQRRRGVDGVFGLSESAWWGFTAELRYRRGFFGIPELTCGSNPPASVFAPYASALALPFSLSAAGDCLLRLRALSMAGRLGYFDSLDTDPAHLPEGSRQELVQCHIASHQAMTLCAICNALTDRALVRHFTALPVVSAFAPLLREPPKPPLILPPRLLHPTTPAQRDRPWRRNAQTLTTPMDAQLIGSPECCMLMSAQGMGMMCSRGMLLTRFTGDPGETEGIQFFIRDRDTVFQPTDPTLPGEAVFEEGLARFTRTGGEISAALTAAVDPSHGGFIHLLELVNLSVQEKTVDVADCLIPCLAPLESIPQDERSFRTDRPGDRLLTITHRDPEGEPITLCHGLSTHAEVLTLAVETDRLAFQGRACTMRQPASLHAPMAEGFLGTPAAPCASFRVRLHLGGRGRASLMFTTRLLSPGEAPHADEPSARISDAEDILSMSRLLSRVMTDTCGLAQDHAAKLSRLFGSLLWRLQPHQGALSPLRASADALRSLRLDPTMPLLAVIISSEDGLPLLQEAALLQRWMRLMGVAVLLCVLCEGDRAEEAYRAAESCFDVGQEGVVLLVSQQLPDGLRDTIEAVSRLILFEGAGDAAAQLSALQARYPIPVPPPMLPDAPPLPSETLLADNGFGGFRDQGGDYVIRLSPGEATPAAWSHPLTGEGFSTMALESGLASTRTAAGLLTPEPWDAAYPLGGEYVLLQDDAGHVWSPTGLPLGQLLSRRITYAPGVATYQSFGCDLAMTLTAGCIPGRRGGIRTLRLKDQSGRNRHVTCRLVLRFVMGEAGASEALTYLTKVAGGVVAVNPAMAQIGFLCVTEEDVSIRRVSVLSMTGLWSGAPAEQADSDDPCGTAAILTRELELPAGGSASITWVIGAARSADDIESLLALVRNQGASALLRGARQRWTERLERLTVSTPDAAFDLMLNRVLPYQIRAMQLEGRRSAFHPDGRIRFAEHLMNAMALLPTEPERVRAALLLCAHHQYLEGDVQHVWTPPRTGLRTQLVTDRLMLPLSTARYAAYTGDADVLQEVCPYLTGAPVEAGQSELLATPAVTEVRDSLYAHCVRALTSVHIGPRGLPRENGCESVMAGMVYASALEAFAAHCDGAMREDMQSVHHRLMDAIEHFGWDNDRYLWGFTSEERAIGSASGSVDQLMLLPQAWAVLAHCAPTRCSHALGAAWQRLFDPTAGVLRCAAFSDEAADSVAASRLSGRSCHDGNSTQDMGRALQALCDLGWSEQAWTLLGTLTPMLHADTQKKAAAFRSEPYALPTRLSVLPGHQERGGLHRSGAALVYMVMLEKLLGFEKQGGRVRMVPMLPPAWDGFTLMWRYGGSTWHFMAGRDVQGLTCDGDACEEGWVTLTDDGRTHQVRVPVTDEGLRRPKVSPLETTRGIAP